METRTSKVGGQNEIVVVGNYCLYGKAIIKQRPAWEDGLLSITDRLGN